MALSGSYNVIKQNGESEIVVTKSRFIGNLVSVSSAQEAEEFITSVRKKYNDARHNCWAYIVMDGDMIINKCSDDGEPSGTAGRPILSIMEGAGLVNAVCTVTRYFGGVLLGTGGLVRAYSDAAKEALLAAETGELVDCVMRKYSGIAYGDYDKVRFILEKNGITDYETEYGSEVSITAYIPAQLDEGITGEITDSTRGTCTPENLGTMRVVRNTESLNEA